MPDRMQLVTLRLHPKTIDLIDQLASHPDKLHPKPKGHLADRPSTRTQILRHAITAGLDVLTQQEPLELTEPDPCPSGKTTRPPTTVKAATAS